ncbi:hypothetical protein CBR_g81581 [Chara braunii]|uniref:Uncharacterized protein n=1 Tax=Chara braunii TaxID=69332 RepID=A0A388KAY0_CHABU|nr:hypothetical protein CBR_g81581 [Chara braunii]|eukprot:GBG67156.1 hypothetical protein CBR_g81581 [Chara braunii]
MDGLNASTEEVGETIDIGTEELVEAMTGVDVTMSQQTNTNAQEGGMEKECGIGATMDVGIQKMVMGDDDELGRGRNSHSTIVIGKEVADRQDVGKVHFRMLCIVPNENVRRINVGECFQYAINWGPRCIQPGIIIGEYCLAFKCRGSWMPYQPPTPLTWRNVTAAIVLDRLIRLNDSASLSNVSRLSLDMWNELSEAGDLRLNDFLYDGVVCRESWVMEEDTGRMNVVTDVNDPRRDVQWGWVPSQIPFRYGHCKILVRYLMGNCWKTTYVNDEFRCRFFDRKVCAQEKDAMTHDGHNAGDFCPQLAHSVRMELSDDKVFRGAESVRYELSMETQATYCVQCYGI